MLEATAHGLGHGHFDRLSWMFYDNGGEIVPDYGAARFLNVVQKNGGRYLPENKTWAKQTVAHNTLVVDGRSQFGGDRHAAELSPLEMLCCEMDGTELQIVAARDMGSYPGVEITRTLAMLDLPELDHPLILDVLDAQSGPGAEGGTHSFDLPLYYQGQLVESRPAPSVDGSALAPVGDAHGYQHLWARGRAQVEAGESYALTWLKDGRFYTHTTVGSSSMDVVLTEVGANDPHFNLRREPGLLLRVPEADQVTFFSVLEPHGQYDGGREFTRRSRSRLTSLAGHRETAPDGTILYVWRLELAEGQTVSLALAPDGDPEAEYSISLPTGELRWTGTHRFWDQ